MPNHRGTAVTTINEQAGVHPASHLFGHTGHTITIKNHIRRNETVGSTTTGLMKRVFGREAWCSETVTGMVYV